MSPRIVTVCLVAALTAVLSACQGIGGLRDQDQASRLHDSVRLYVQAVRWRKPDVVAGLLRPRAVNAPPVDTSALEKMTVTNADYRLGGFSSETGEATVEVTFEYTYGDSVRVKKLVQKSLWWYEEEARIWYVDGGLPDFAR